MAAHNSGGIVIVQVERLVERGTIPTKAVHLPGAIVDKASSVGGGTLFAGWHCRAPALGGRGSILLQRRELQDWHYIGGVLQSKTQ